MVIIGAILIFKKELFLQYIPKDINDKLNIVYQNNTIVGSILITCAYYFYTQNIKSSQPSYTESTSELVSSQ